MADETHDGRDGRYVDDSAGTVIREVGKGCLDEKKGAEDIDAVLEVEVFYGTIRNFEVDSFDLLVRYSKYL